MDHGGGGGITGGNGGGENGRHRQAGRGHKIGGKKPSEETKYSDQDHRRAFIQKGRQLRRSVWTQRKGRKGGTGE